MRRYHLSDGAHPGYSRTPSDQIGKTDGTVGSAMLSEALAMQKFGYVPGVPAAPSHAVYEVRFPGKTNYTILRYMLLYTEAPGAGLVMAADIASASASSYYGSWVPENAMQGAGGQGWQSSSGSELKWLRCTLSLPKMVRAMRLVTAYPSSYYSTFDSAEVYSSLSGVPNVARGSFPVPWVDSIDFPGYSQSDFILSN